MAKADTKHLVVCIQNDGYPASPERRKIYITLTDRTAERNCPLRVIDESGQDHLCLKDFFREIALPETVKRAVLAAA
jgi:hypothetical protein